MSFQQLIDPDDFKLECSRSRCSIPFSHQSRLYARKRRSIPFHHRPRLCTRKIRIKISVSGHIKFRKNVFRKPFRANNIEYPMFFGYYKPWL